ncbi:MAG: hypothetical protein ABIH89_00430 [Elusimicrobiota bacterium]
MLSVLFGLVSIVIGVVWLLLWGAWSQFLTVMQGSVPPFLVLVGLVAIAAGISSLKDNAAARREEDSIDDESSDDSDEGGSESSPLGE